jgi:penicillin-binding protein 1A
MENMITEAQKIRTSKLTHRIKFQTESHRRNGLILESILGLHEKMVDDNKTRWLRLRHIQRTENLHNDRLRMQLHAEEAVFAHMANLQRRVFIQAKTIKCAPL